MTVSAKNRQAAVTLEEMFRTDGLLRSKVLLHVLVSAVAAIGSYTPFLYLKSFDFESLFYLAFLLAITLVFGLFVLIHGFFRKKWVKPQTWIAIVGFVAVSFIMCRFDTHLRPWARWLISSNSYKRQVLAQSAVDSSGIRFIDWDGWGWAGAGTEVFLIYDPSDTLKFGTKDVRENKKSLEIIEKSQFIQRLDNNWYSATLYTDQYLSSEE